MSRLALTLLALTLAGCPKSGGEGGGTAAADAGTAAQPVLPTSFHRSFRGTIGDNLGITMFLSKLGSALEGTYAYDSTKREIKLSGAMSGPVAFALTETVDGKQTGSFKGSIAADGSLSGTWSDATGAKTLPFTLREAAVAREVASTAVSAAPPTDRTPINALTDDEHAAFLVQFAKAKGAPGGASTTAQALLDYRGLLVKDWVGFMKKYGLPGLDSSYFVVYLADANNDGTADYVLTSRNDVGLHNDDIVGVFTPKGASFEQLTLPKTGPLGPNRVQFFGKTLLSHDSEGVTMSFVDQKVEKRYLWKGTTLKAL